MIIINLKGGLGNQMFQYAMGRGLAHVSNQEMKLDRGFLDNPINATKRHYELSLLNIKEDFVTEAETRKYVNLKTKIVNKLLPFYRGNPYRKERYFNFDPTISKITGDRYLDGHWMSEKYFSHIESIIRTEFAFKREVLDAGKSLLSRILNSNSICIQVRRGDYINNKRHETTSITYFEQGVTYIKSKVVNPVFFVFSDDIKWCEENLSGIGNVHFVEKELAHTAADNSDFLQLMIACKHFIISNSTFAWWAAWLSANLDKIVVAPKNWFNDQKIITKDIYPAAWIKI